MWYSVHVLYQVLHFQNTSKYDKKRFLYTGDLVFIWFFIDKQTPIECSIRTILVPCFVRNCPNFFFKLRDLLIVSSLFIGSILLHLIYVLVFIDPCSLIASRAPSGLKTQVRNCVQGVKENVWPQLG